MEALYGAVRDVPDFPKPGIVFKDITPVLLDPKLLGLAVNLMASAFRGAGTTRVVAIESRGFLLAPPIALALGAGLVPVRKPGKLPAAAHRVDYALEYGTDALEMHRDALGPGERVLVVDDVLATGGTAAAAVRLVRGTGADLVGLAFLIELDFLHGRRQLEGLRIEALLHY
ncbi:MAG: adenine phosphoribosyltransferase [Gemmatimonadales bacterium]